MKNPLRMHVSEICSPLAPSRTFYVKYADFNKLEIDYDTINI